VDCELRIGTRGSLLALTQSELVSAGLKALYADLSITVVTITTSGDKIMNAPLAKVGGKGLFVKEIEEALLAGRVDLAVHSMKDVPTNVASGLTIAAVTERETPYDVLISRRGEQLHALPKGARVGTSSLRRQAQLLHYRPDLTIVPLRGNVDTRLRKLSSEGLDAIVVAGVGMYRLGLQDQITQVLPPEISLSAIGQGALGLEIRREDHRTHTLIEPLNHRPTELAVTAERAFLKRLGGGCQVPIAAHGRLKNGQLHLMGLVIRPDGTGMIRGEITGRMEEAEDLGTTLAEDLLPQGADRILEELQQMVLRPPAAP
jgi:hydroxymethylbilane synthase